jgi:uncharacterized protein (TIGR03437 family)
MYQIGYTGSYTITAYYSGDAAFSSGSGTRSIRIGNPPEGVTSIVPSAPTTVFPQPADAQGLAWQTLISLNEVAGVPAFITGLTIDGVSQNLSQYFPSTAIEPLGVVSATFVFRGLAAPVTRTFVFTGTDPTGAVWTRQVAVAYLPVPVYDYFNLTATPITVVQNPANTACPWSVQLNVDDLGGFGVNQITTLQYGGVDISSTISSVFGTTQLDAYDGVQGTLCFSNITPPATDFLFVGLSDNAGFYMNINFAGPAANPARLSATPASVNIAATAKQPGTATLALNLSDKTQQWTALVFPTNRTTSWLSVSQLSGTGPANITLTANPTGFEPGVYRATIVFQCSNAVPQYINVPVMFTLGGAASGITITAIANAASYQTQISPGMLASVFGTGLSNATNAVTASPLPYANSGVTATVNGLAAPVIYASSTMLNIQVPFAAGAGPAVLGVNNNGQVAGFAFQISPVSPGIFADGNGNVVPTAVVSQGGELAFYVTGTGDVSPLLPTAFSPVSSAPGNIPVPLQPVSVTVGGTPAFLEFVGITPGLIGVTQINVLVPHTAPTGNQPLVVTVGSTPSVPVNVVVQPLK